MNLEKLLQFLEAASAPDRKLDVLLGIQIGYERHLARHVEETEPLRMKWKKPDGDIGNMPSFTESVDAAWEFALAFNGEIDIIAVAIDEHGRGSAQINEVKALHLPNAALALCVAAVQARLARKNP